MKTKSNASLKPFLQEETLELWSTKFSDIMPNYDVFFNSLSLDEKKREKQFVFPEHAKNFALGRGYLRYVLSQYLEISAKNLKFTYSPYGKPEIDTEQNTVGLKFNLSHAHEYLMCAVERSCPVGLDIEYVKKDFAVLDIANRFFSATEYQFLLDASISDRTEHFFYLWTRKEALAKAIGNRLDFCLSTNVMADHVKVEDLNQTFFIKSVPVFAGYQAAVVRLD